PLELPMPYVVVRRNPTRPRALHLEGNEAAKAHLELLRITRTRLTSRSAGHRPPRRGCLLRETRRASLVRPAFRSAPWSCRLRDNKEPVAPAAYEALPTETLFAPVVC